MSHKKVIRSSPFWRNPKELNPTSKDYRPASDDLNLLPGEWGYRKESYESDLADMRKAERNIAKLDESLNPNQRL